MTPRTLLALLLAAFGFALSMPAAAQPAKDAPVQIGLVKQFFNDVPETLVNIATQPFADLMKMTTGYEGKLSYKYDAFEIARKLDKGELHIGVFHGHEFAWLQKQYPKLQPMMLALNQHKDVRAFVVVNKESKATCIKDLQGKNIDLPFATKEHCCVYLDKACSDNAGQGAKNFFKSVSKCKSPIEALDNVRSGKLDAVLVDTITLEFYKQEKGSAAFDKFLKVLVQSEEFPPPVIVFKEGGLQPEMIKKFRAGLAIAHESPEGRDILQMWQIDCFVPVPESYSASLTDSLKRYPLPPTK